jgi:hypothetical protein
MEKEVIEIRNVKFWLEEDGILRAVTDPTAKITLEDAKAHLETIRLLNKGKRHPILADIRQIGAIYREARVYFSSEELAKDVSAVALWVGSPVSRIIGNFLIGMNKLFMPTRLFDSEEKALEWLKGFL